MPDLLLELCSEEIPARMQGGAARDLERLVVGALSDRGYLFEGIKAFAGPRRLSLAICGLPARQSDVQEELRGPKTDAPPAALEGFLRKTGLTKEQLKIQQTPKGAVYRAVIAREGRQTALVLGEILADVLARLPWPKSMRWKPGSPVRWVRPLHSIVCTFDGEVVALSFAGISSGRQTRGHRFLSQGTIEVRRFDDYVQKLRAAHVVLDAEERMAIIQEGVRQAAFVHGLEMIPDEGLLAEVAGLVEWPVVYTGAIAEAFMELPPEILQTAMRVHQKYFSLRQPAAPGRPGAMANRFALVANMVAADGGKEIVAGNERVLRARLSDAKFFWDEDRKRTLESRIEKLKGIIFHAKLGSQYERVRRLQHLAGQIAGILGADVAKARRAALLAKADLTTGMVGEFPELQGIMGRYYALHDKEEKDVAMAIGAHYGPVGKEPVSDSALTNALSLADKWDIISQFFKIGERPGGSGDPYAIRRAALSMIRILLARKYRLGLSALPDCSDEILGFFAERLKVALRERGVRHDLIDAVIGLGKEDDLVRLVARVEALQGFLDSRDGANLLAGYRRAANILKLEEKKDGKVFISEVHEGLLSEGGEIALFAAMAGIRASVRPHLEKEDFVCAMQQMAALRVPVDDFFDKVKVNADDGQVRENRLNLLASLRATLHQVADFSKIEG